MMHTRPGFAEILQATYTDGKLNSNFYEGGREGQGWCDEEQQKTIQLVADLSPKTDESTVKESVIEVPRQKSNRERREPPQACFAYNTQCRREQTNQAKTFNSPSSQQASKQRSLVLCSLRDTRFSQVPPKFVYPSPQSYSSQGTRSGCGPSHEQESDGSITQVAARIRVG